MIRLEAKKSVSIHEDEGGRLVKRRTSNTSSASNLRQRSASAMSRRRLSAVSETGGQESAKNKDEVSTVFVLSITNRLFEKHRQPL